MFSILRWVFVWKWEKIAGTCRTEELLLYIEGQYRQIVMIIFFLFHLHSFFIFMVSLVLFSSVENQFKSWVDDTSFNYEVFVIAQADSFWSYLKLGKNSGSAWGPGTSQVLHFAIYMAQFFWSAGYHLRHTEQGWYQW
jgi:hypothetical protein